MEKLDVHNPYLTVRESLRFSAKLRQDPSVPLEEKYAYVEEVLEVTSNQNQKKKKIKKCLPLLLDDGDDTVG